MPHPLPIPHRRALSPRRTPVGCAILVLLILVGRSVAAPALTDSFDGAQTSWRLERGSVARSLSQQRMRIERDGEPTGVEWLRYACRPGYVARYWRPLDRAPVLDELKLSVTLRCELPGGTLAARVVLPRTIDPTTNRPKTVFIRGGRYESPGEWRQLTLEDTPGLVADAARLLRAQPGAPPIDERGAYVDRVILILPGAPAGASAWTDELQVHGVLLPSGGEQPSVAGAAIPNLQSESLPEQQRVSLTAAGFAIGERPFYPRIWAHAGEALTAVREAGFNTVAFRQPATAEQLAEAKKLRLRIICPPPYASLQPKEVSRDWAPVLAWTISPGDRSVDSARAFVERIRESDLALQRPVIAAPNNQWSQWSRLADVVAIEKNGPNGVAAQRLWQERLADVLRLSRPGAPFLLRIDITLADEARSQLAVLAGSESPASRYNGRELAMEIWSAVAKRAAGVWVSSGRRLSGADAETQQLRHSLTLINLQLELANPWLAGGTWGPQLTDSTGTTHAALLKRGRVRLLVPAGSSRPGPAPPGASFIVPGVTESSAAYRLTTAGLLPLKLQRVAGGVRVDAAEVGIDRMVILTDDRPAVRTIAARAAKNAKASVTLVQQLARVELASRSDASTVDARISSDPMRRGVEQLISVSNAASAAGNYLKAYQSATDARQRLASNQVASYPGESELRRSPLALSSSYRDADRRLAELLGGAPRGANLLSGGDFEDLNATRSHGWINTNLPLEGTTTAVQLSSNQPAHGAKCLRLSVESPAGQPLPLAAGDCLVWVTTPAISLVAGQLVEVSGWVRVTTTDKGKPARLIISDTLGGEQLARIVEPTARWRSFRLLRRAPRDAELRVTFGLSGVGEGFVDAVMVRPIQIGVTPTPPVRMTPVAERAGQDNATR